MNENSLESLHALRVFARSSCGIAKHWNDKQFGEKARNPFQLKWLSFAVFSFTVRESYYLNKVCDQKIFVCLFPYSKPFFDRNINEMFILLNWKVFPKTLLSDWEEDERKEIKILLFTMSRLLNKYIFLELENKKNSRNVFRDYWIIFSTLFTTYFSMSLTFLYSPMTELCFHKSKSAYMRKRCVKQ